MKPTKPSKLTIEQTAQMAMTPATPATPATLAEQAELQQLETQVARGLQAFYEAGSALREIRDRKLYRASHPTFEQYLEHRWGIGAAHAYRLIAAATTVDQLLLSPGGNILPNAENQVRPLQALPPERQPQAWALACSEAGGVPTSEQVAAAVAQLKSQIATIPGPDATSAAELEAAIAASLDALGPLPPERRFQILDLAAEAAQCRAGAEGGVYWQAFQQAAARQLGKLPEAKPLLAALRQVQGSEYRRILDVWASGISPASLLVPELGAEITGIEVQPSDQALVVAVKIPIPSPWQEPSPAQRGRLAQWLTEWKASRCQPLS